MTSRQLTQSRSRRHVAPAALMLPVAATLLVAAAPVGINPVRSSTVQAEWAIPAHAFLVVPASVGAPPRIQKDPAVEGN